MNTKVRKPIRMCLGCRGRRPQDELLRFRRRPDGFVEFAPLGARIRRPGGAGTTGRTAYLCPSRSCYDLSMKKRAWVRGFAGNKGLSVRVEPTTLWPSILNGLENNIQQLVRSGATPHRGRLFSTIRRRAELGVRGKDA